MNGTNFFKKNCLKNELMIFEIKSGFRYAT